MRALDLIVIGSGREVSADVSAAGRRPLCSGD